MTINEYQKEAMRTASNLNKDSLIVEGAMGLCGESGECIDLVKKSTFQGHKLDRKALALELGDVAWYLAALSLAIDYDLETILSMNIEKLKSRYPDGFTTNNSINRKE